MSEILEKSPRRRPLIGKHWIQYYRPYDLDWAILVECRPYGDRDEAYDRMCTLAKDYPSITFRLMVRDWDE